MISITKQRRATGSLARLSLRGPIVSLSSAVAMTVPRTIAELHKLFDKWKTEFESRLDLLERSNKSLIDQIKDKDAEINKLKEAEAANTQALKQQSVLQKVVDNHQNFLEKTDSYRRECNVVIYGLAESSEVQDADQVKEVSQEIECADTIPEKYVRLGKVQETVDQTVDQNVDQQTNEEEEERPRPPRPLLVVCKTREERSNVLSKTSKLKLVEKFKKVYVKKDQTPYERKEWGRLKEVLIREKKRPGNQGMNVKIDYRTKSVMVGERVVEKGNFRRGPEW